MIFAIICGNDRLEYRKQCIASFRAHFPDIPYLVQNDDYHEGMAANVQHGFELFLHTNANYCLWLEEDFIFLSAPPLDHAITVLDTHDRLAQMLFQRQPLSGAEIATGSVIGGMGDSINHGTWHEQKHIFSLNPCLIPRRVMELGWPSGPLGVGNETGMTNKLLGLGYTFGVWEGQYVEHIGEERGPGWRL